MKDLTHLVSKESLRRRPSRVKDEYQHYTDPDMVSLGGGLPEPRFFPLQSLQVRALCAPLAEDGSSPNLEHIVCSKIDTDTSVNSEKIPLRVGLQYGSCRGHPQLVQFLKTHHTRIHEMQYEDWDLMLTTGNTHAWDMTLRLFCDPGDTIVTEEFSFVSALENASFQGVNVVPLPMHNNELDTARFAEIMRCWQGKKPKLLYTVPTGQNPTGGTVSNEQRQEIYNICRKHDIVIIEDDPYYFLQYGEYGKASYSPTHEEFLNSLVRSYLKFDIDGRVVRLDSFSKTLCPGSRTGWIVAQKPIISRYLSFAETSCQMPSGFSQMIVNELLQSWGHVGYLNWLIGVRNEYVRKRDVAIGALQKYVPKTLVKFEPPVAGMFFWLAVDAGQHPNFESAWSRDPDALESYLYKRALKYGVHVFQGSWFRSSKGPDSTIYFRGTYASASTEQIEIGVKRLADLIKDEFQVQVPS